MTLNQRKSELYAAAAVAVAVAGALPELDLWWGRGGARGGIYGGDGTSREQEELAKKWRARNTVRGVLVLVGGVLVGGWAVWI